MTVHSLYILQLITKQRKLCFRALFNIHVIEMALKRPLDSVLCVIFLI